MKIIGTSREGCWAILILSGIVLFFAGAGHFRLELNATTCIFVGLNLAAVCGLLTREWRNL